MSRSPRYNIYAFIHKGLRAFMTHTLVRVGRLDALDAAEVAEAGDEVRALLEMCASHLKHENEVIHVAMDSRRPGAASRIEDEHVQHLDAIAGLRAMLDRVSGDPACAQALYHALVAFVAHNFEHMEQEETVHNAVLWATHSDDELRALEHRIVSTLGPREKEFSLRWMLPHMTPSERTAMLGGMRQGMPVAAFAAVVAQIRPLLGGRDWRKLSVALGL
jgi:hypothetical protein